MLRALVVLLASLCAAGAAHAGDDAILVVKGKGAEGRKAYAGPGKVEFLGVTLADSLVHFAGQATLPVSLQVRYRVLETAPVLLNSRLGSEHYGDEKIARLYTREPIDLSKEGEATAGVTEARVDTRGAGALASGLVGIRGRSYFLIDRPDGQWLDVVNAPPFFDAPDLVAKLLFTLADLTRFTLHFEAVESTWQPGGPLGAACW